MDINKVVCMDNLEFMKLLPSESIDLIYSDILYGTGKNFKDYQDLKADRKIIEEFYYPRIIEMHRVLKPTGSIYLQCDWHINHWIRCLLDDIFGYENFKNEIIWAYSWGSRNNKCWNRKHDNIYMYSKESNITFNANEVLEERRLTEQSKERLKYKGSLIKDFNKRKNELALPTDVWYISTINGMAKEKVGYNTQKPLALMEKIVKASSNEGDVVADFFMGSGSFLIKAKELGRQYIGCDINPKAVELTNQRLIS